MQNYIENNIGALILATDNQNKKAFSKPFLKFNGSKLFIENIIDSYLEFGCSKIIVVINDKESFWKLIINKYEENDEVIFITNNHPEFGDFYSIKIGLLEMNNISYCFLQNCNNPFVEFNIIKLLYTKRKTTAFVVPTFKGKDGYPILLGDDIINYILSFDKNDLNFQDILFDCPKIDCTVTDEKVILNISSLKDYQKYFEKNQ